MEFADKIAEARLDDPATPRESLASMRSCLSNSPIAYDCRAGFEGGQICALDYSAVCHIERRGLVEHCGA